MVRQDVEIMVSNVAGTASNWGATSQQCEGENLAVTVDPVYMGNPVAIFSAN